MNEWLGVRLFGYISFRVAMAALTGFALALAFGRPTIAWLKRHRVREVTDSTDAPELDRMAREIAAVEKLDERGAVQRITDVLSKSAKGRRAAEEAAEAAEAEASANADVEAA